MSQKVPGVFLASPEAMWLEKDTGDLRTLGIAREVALVEKLEGVRKVRCFLVKCVPILDIYVPSFCVQDFCVLKNIYLHILCILKIQR